VLVYIWHLDTQQGRSFKVSYKDTLFSNHQLECARFPPELTLLLQPGTKTIVLSTFDSCHTSDHNHYDFLSKPIVVNPPKILYSRFTYTGECLQNASQSLDGLGPLQPAPDGTSTNRFVPASHNGLFSLHVNRYKDINFSLQFDEQLNAFTTPKYPESTSLWLPGPTRNPNLTNPNSQSHIAWWKDTFIEASPTNPILTHLGTR
jgi:hypothetical protein